MVFEYVGGNCASTTNSVSGTVTCSQTGGAALGNIVSVSAGSTQVVNPTQVSRNGEFTLGVIGCSLASVTNFVISDGVVTQVSRMDGGRRRKRRRKRRRQIRETLLLLLLLLL